MPNKMWLMGIMANLVNVYARTTYFNEFSHSHFYLLMYLPRYSISFLCYGLKRWPLIIFQLAPSFSNIKDLNDDLSSTLTVHQVAETRSKIDCPINAIVQIMFSGRHISVNWTIMGWSSLCYLMNGLDLMKGRRLGP